MVANGLPLVAKSSPVGAKRSPLVAKASPVGAKPSPVMARDSPMMANGSPMVTNGSPIGANNLPAVAKGSPVGAKASPVEANFRMESLTRHVLGCSGQTVAQNETCLISLKSSRKILSNDTKNTPSPFIDQKLCKFYRPGFQRTFASAGKAFASAGKATATTGERFANGGKFPPGEFDPRRFGAPSPNGSSE
ncbi:hypothetical protein R1flu_020768 [Riccia fluitans]|uniref:Uncharacterized protein n=1 Tax=Riccia fluitans TaxID=41844 RepID=A0ABD1ZNY8_9MARC